MRLVCAWVRAASANKTDRANKKNNAACFFIIRSHRVAKRWLFLAYSQGAGYPAKSALTSYRRPHYMDAVSIRCETGAIHERRDPSHSVQERMLEHARDRPSRFERPWRRHAVAETRALCLCGASRHFANGVEHSRCRRSNAAAPDHTDAACGEYSRTQGADRRRYLDSKPGAALFRQVGSR